MKKRGTAIGSKHKLIIRPDGKVLLELDKKAIRAKLPANRQIAARKASISRVRVVKPTV